MQKIKIRPPLLLLIMLGSTSTVVRSEESNDDFLWEVLPYIIKAGSSTPGVSFGVVDKGLNERPSTPVSSGLSGDRGLQERPPTPVSTRVIDPGSRERPPTTVNTSTSIATLKASMVKVVIPGLPPTDIWDSQSWISRMSNYMLVCDDNFNCAYK